MAIDIIIDTDLSSPVSSVIDNTIREAISDTIDTRASRYPLYVAQRIAFKLEWDDDTVSTNVTSHDDHDAIVVLLLTPDSQASTVYNTKYKMSSQLIYRIYFNFNSQPTLDNMAW